MGSGDRTPGPQSRSYGKEGEPQEEVHQSHWPQRLTGPKRWQKTQKPPVPFSGREGAGREYPPRPLVKFLGPREPTTLPRRSSAWRDAWCSAIASSSRSPGQASSSQPGVCLLPMAKPYIPPAPGSEEQCHHCSCILHLALSKAHYVIL